MGSRDDGGPAFPLGLSTDAADSGPLLSSSDDDDPHDNGALSDEADPRMSEADSAGGIEQVRKTLSTLARTVDMHGPLFDSAVGGAVDPQVQLLQAAVASMQCSMQMVGLGGRGAFPI